MLKVAIIGCGKIADDHAAQIAKIPTATIVAACDLEPLMAAQFCERFQVAGAYSELDDLLAHSRPDVAHITTPPQSHHILARRCLEAGVSVYVEKPFTVSRSQAAELVELAVKNRLKLTVGHDLQFSPVSNRLRSLVREGYIGISPVHLESYYCYDLSDPKYARSLMGDKNHWIRRLPGGLLHNIISHGIARIAEYCPSEAPEVLALGFRSPTLLAIGEKEFIDELRVTVRDPMGPTAYFTFSSQLRPSLRAFRIFGQKNALELDEDKQTLIRLHGTPFKSYAERFLPPVLTGLQYFRNSTKNVGAFLSREFHMKLGMRCLMAQFYDSILTNGAPPISYREILLTAGIMDSIFAQVAQFSAGNSPGHNKDSIVLEGAK